MKRGEIWEAVWPNEPFKKRRPVLIVSNDHRNITPALPDITVIKITSLVRPDGSRKSVNQAEDFVVKFKKESIIRCGSIFSIEKSTLQRILGQLTPSQMTEVNERLKNSLGL
jgi:mRNA-degrading endonuclease toxin of MazEF toxin-antitoxin module